MATYLKGVTDYIPEVQPFTPNYNLYGKVLSFKQGKFDAASKQLSSLYSSLLNAPLTREDNTEARDKFFKVIDQDIKKMATLDLSLQQNLDAAKDVFNGLLDNKNIAKDMVWTKNWMNEMQRGESLRNCVDPKKCGGTWWEGGDQYMNLKRMEFKNADPNQAMAMGKTNYVAAQNITEKAMAIAKDLDIEIEADPVRQGGFIIKGSDDAKEAQVFNNLLMGAIGKDPLVQDYYRAQQYNKRMNFALSNEQKYGSIDAANTAYINENFAVLSNLETREAQAEDDLNNTKAKQTELQKIAANTIPANRRSMVDINNELQKETAAYTETVGVLKEANGHGRVAVNNANNPAMSASSMDKVLGNLQLSGEITGVANNLAMAKVTRDIEVDDYALENVKFKNRLFMEDVKSQNKFKLEKFKFNLEQAAEQLKAQGTSNMNTSTKIDIKGANAVGDLDSDSDENMMRTYNAFDKKIKKASNSLSASENALITEVLYKTKNEGRLGDVQAKEDYVNMVYGYFNAYNDAPSDDPNDATLPKLNAIVRQMQGAKTLNERYKIAEKAELDLEKLAGPALDGMYDKIYAPILNPKSKKAALRKKYLNEVWQQSFKHKQTIKAKDMILSQMDDVYVDQVTQVMGGVNSSPQMSALGPILKAYIDPSTGRPRSNDEFARILANDPNYTYRDGIDMINGDYDDMDDIVGDDLEDYKLNDLWKVAFTEFAVPNSSGIAPGLGDKFTQGNLYSMVDPDAYSSNAVQGTVSYLRNALTAKDVIFAKGDFEENLPSDDSDAKLMTRQILNGINTYKGKDYRPIFDVTYSNIAGSTDSHVGLNIKVLNEQFFDKFKGVKDDRSDLYEKREDIMQNGITIYLPRTEANNIFTQRAEQSPLDDVMTLANEIDFDQYDPNYIKDLKLTNSREGYILTGDVRVGLNPDGTPEFDAIREVYNKGGAGTLEAIASDINLKMEPLLQIGQAQDNQYMQNNR